MMLAVPVAQAAKVSPEYRLKAALIFKLTRFISWNDTAPAGQHGDAAEVNICVVGDNPFGDALDGMQGMQSNNRQIRLHYLAAAESLNRCQLAFIAEENRAMLTDVVNSTAGKPVVTLSDIRGFAREGGMIEIIRRNSRLSFTINMKTVRQSGVRIATPLLQISNLIRQQDREK